MEASKQRQQYQASLVELIGSRPVAYYPALAKKVGGVKAAVMLSQLLYWNGDQTVQKRDGWFWKSVEDMENETGLTKTEQQTARDDLIERGIIETKLKGIPRIWHYKVNINALGDILIEQESHPMENPSNEEPSDIGRESAPILGGEPAQLNKESKTTSKTTTETTTGGETPPTETGLSVGQKYFLEQFGAKRYKTKAQKDTIQALEKTHGTDKLKQVILWTAKKGMSMGDAITSIETALPKWGQNHNGNGRNGNGHHPEPPDKTEAEKAAEAAEVARMRAIIDADYEANHANA